MDDLLNRPLVEVAQALRTGEVSSLELTSAAVARAQAINPTLNAFVRIDEARALATAQRADDERARGRLLGPLHGVPLAHKDMFYRAGEVSTCGSAIRRDWRASVTSGALERLDAAGAIQIGTLNMTEFAYGPTGQNAFLGDARNPWNPEYITGGSSSGSGVSVAARAVFGALGSDTGGSVRSPAGICGVVGMKTTFGRVTRYGAMPLSATLDTIGPLTRTVADNALLLQVIAGYDARDPSTAQEPVVQYSARLGRSVKRLRIGVPVGYFDRNLAKDVEKTLERSQKIFKSLGCELVSIKMPNLDLVNAAGTVITWAEVNTIHGEWMRNQPDQYTAQTRGRIELSLAASAKNYQDALRFRGPALREFAETVFGRCDALLAPNIAIATPKISDVDVSGGPQMLAILGELTRLFRPANYFGLPALALPAGLAANGLPTSIQLMGRPFAEAMLYRLGHQFERELDWKAQPDLNLG